MISVQFKSSLYRLTEYGISLFSLSLSLSLSLICTKLGRFFQIYLNLGFSSWIEFKIKFDNFLKQKKGWFVSFLDTNLHSWTISCFNSTKFIISKTKRDRKNHFLLKFKCPNYFRLNSTKMIISRTSKCEFDQSNSNLGPKFYQFRNLSRIPFFRIFYSSNSKFVPV